MPRPKRAQGVTSRIDVRVTEDEKTILLIQADKAAVTLSEYIRRCSLNKRLHSRVSDKAIARLSSLCGLQKHLLTQLNNQPHEDELRRKLNAILAAIHTTLRTVIGTTENAQ